MSDSPTTGAMLHGPGGLLATPGLGGVRKRKWGQRAGGSVGKIKEYTKDPSGSRSSIIDASHDGQCNTGLNLSKVKELTGNTESQRGHVPSTDPSMYVIGVDRRSMPAIIPQCICGLTTKAVGQPGEHIAPGITRIHDNLCNVHGRYGPCDAAFSAKPKKGRARKPRAPKKVALTSEQKRAARDAQHSQNQSATLAKLNIAPDGQAALAALRKGDQADPAAIVRGGFEKAGLVTRAQDGSYHLTASGRAALGAAQSGDAGRTGDIVSGARDRASAAATRVQARQARQQAAAARHAQIAQRRARVAARRAGKKTAPIAGVATATKAQTDQSQFAGYTMDDWDDGLSVKKASREEVEAARTHFAQALGLDTVAQPAAKSFTVYKDHAGAQRWIARTTTAYRDRDDEILSTDTLDRDSQRMTATKQFGPLRYWHCGKPDPTSDTAPWGPGLDIGDCDYSVMIGHTRVESGTFRNPIVAEKMAQSAHLHEMSPGFFHAPDAPDVDGVFHDIRTFERSVVPIRFARASNLFTGITVKEFSMDLNEIERRFKASITDLGLDSATALSLAQGLIATEKEASAQQIAFKSTEYPDVVLNGVTYKAFPPAPADAPPDTTDVTVDDPAAPPDEPDGDYVGDMSTDDFKAMMSEMLAPVLKLQDMLKTMGDMHGEMKAMVGGTTTKDDSRAAEIVALKAENERLTTEQTALKSQQTTVAAQLAELLGAQPAVSQTEAEAAFKSAGPSVPTEPNTTPQSTPANPWAGLAAIVMPELYQNGANQ